MNNYPEPIKEYIAALNEDTQEKAIKAVEDLRQKDMPWLWIETALNLKPKSDWEKWGFGLMFRDTFKAQVDKAHSRKKQEIKKAAKDNSFAAPEQPAEYDADKAWCLEHEPQLLALLSCVSWKEVREKLTPSNFGDSPLWFHKDMNQWYPTTKDCFAAEVDPKISVIGKCDSNAASIAYALNNGLVAPEHVEEWQKILESLGESA